jgi:hypothetical protein
MGVEELMKVVLVGITDKIHTDYLKEHNVKISMDGKNQWKVFTMELMIKQYNYYETGIESDSLRIYVFVS